ncbi:MAG: hypothetical protein ACOVP1_03640 [Bacteroidia bacterium]
MNYLKKIILLYFLILLSSCEESTPVINYSLSSNTSVNVQKESNPDEQYSEWNGMWVKGKNYDITSINISNANENGFEFALNGSYGGNLGELSGKAMITEKGEGFFSSAENGLCELYFIRNKKGILIKAASHECGAGMGVRYDGQYVFSSKKDETEVELSFIGLGLVKNQEQSKLLENLVGADKDLFLTSSHQIRNLPIDVETGAKVKSSGVAGLYGEMENIILVNGNQIWAAVIDAEKGEIHYYTNVEEWKQKLPASIKNWSEAIPNKTLIYSSKDGKN